MSADAEAAADPVVIDGDGVRWTFDADFLMSRWDCIWRRGCHGILDEAASHLEQGCCSVGARIEDDDEARLVVANAAVLDPARFARHADARADGVLNAGGTNTRVVDGACIFFNPVGFAGGVGCALHLAAEEHGESPIDWKPSVCWRLPLAVDWDDRQGTTTAHVRRWTRTDWGPGGETMAWCCTEEPETAVALTPLVDRLDDELTEIAGAEVIAELRRRLPVDGR